MTTQELVERLEAMANYEDAGEYHLAAKRLRAAASRLSEMDAENKRLREALTTIGHSLVCAPIDYAEHNAGELLRAGNIARAALEQQQQKETP